MVKRRYRKARGRRSRRRYSRRGRRLGRVVAGLSRKMAAEVKKADNNQLVTQSSFTAVTAQNSTTSNPSLADYGYLYPIMGNTNFAQGTNLDDFIGEQIRIKYLYLGLHLQQINSAGLYQTPAAQGLVGSASNAMFPITLRVMLIQDRNYNNYQDTSQVDNGTNIIDVNTMFYNIFGLDPDSTYGSTETYTNNTDVTLLPINPHEPGRFNVIRDFKMNTAPGWRADYYKKLMLLQKDLNSKGRVYFANNPSQPGVEAPPGNVVSTRYVSRNNLYLLILWQYPYLSGGDTETLTRPIFNLSIQSRLAFYDN